MTSDERAIIMELCAKIAKEYDPVVFNGTGRRIGFLAG